MMRVHSPAAFAGATAMALVLTGCDQRPATIDAPAPLAQLAATAADLPYAEPAPVQWREPQEGYRWAERAYGVQRAVYDAPPDYGFDYGEEEALAWVTADDWSMYAEPWNGGYRYYYYEPGAARPYFIRDREYGYGYDPAGVLVAVFDAGGRYVSRDVVYRVAPAAGRYYVHGGELRSAARRAQRVRIDDRVWATRAPLVERSADPWLRAARDQGDWRAWRERDQDRELRRFEREQRARQQEGERWRERRAALEVAGQRTAQDFPNRQPGYRQAQPAQTERWREAQAERQAQQLARRPQADAARQRQASQQQAEQQQASQQRAEQQQAQAEQRADAARRQQAEEQRQQAQAQRQAQQQAQVAERRQQALAREQAQRQAQQQQARQRAAEQRQQAQAQQQAHAAERRQQAQAQEQAQRQAQQQQARQQAAAQRQQAQAERQARQQAQARAAESQARPAAAQEPGDKPDKSDKPHGWEKND